MRSHFDGDTAVLPASKLSPHPCFGRRHAAPLLHFPILIQHTILTVSVSQVHTDRYRHWLRPYGPPRTLGSGVILLHSRSPFALRVRSIHWELIASRWGPAFSFHLGSPFRAARASKRLLIHSFRLVNYQTHIAADFFFFIRCIVSPRASIFTNL